MAEFTKVKGNASSVLYNLRSGVPSFFSPSRSENKGTPDRRLRSVLSVILKFDSTGGHA